MKIFFALLLFVFTSFSYAQSQDGADILKLAVAKLPPCAVSRSTIILLSFEADHA